MEECMNEDEFRNGWVNECMSGSMNEMNEWMNESSI
jgi:hypothetical protein